MVGHDHHGHGSDRGEEPADVAPLVRVTGYDVPYPFWQIEDAYMPSVERVADAARRVLGA